MKDKMIVMPIQPGFGREADGTGLGIHFLLGNIICLFPELAECWFGWRVTRIFPESGLLTGYCRGGDPFADINGLGSEQKVRFWVEGRYQRTGKGGEAEILLHDTREGVCFTREFALAFEDRLVGFRRDIMEWFGSLGLGWEPVTRALWPEKISPEGLDALGRALEVLYLNYVDGSKTPLDLTLFDRAAGLCPDSYLCQDLLGWGLYKNGSHTKAAKAFERAVALNSSGMGALAGLMWCALADQDRETTLHYAQAKGACRGEDPDKALAFVDKKFT